MTEIPTSHVDGPTPPVLTQRDNPREATLRSARNAALMIMVGFGISNFVIDHLPDGFVKPQTIEDWCYLVMLVTLALLAVLWTYTSGHELSVLTHWLDTSSWRRPSHFAETGMIVFIAVLVTFLMFAAATIRLLAMIYFMYLWVDLYSWRYRRREFRAGIDATRDKLTAVSPELSPVWLGALKSIEVYYFSRPHMFRICIMLGASGVIVTLAWAAHVTGPQWLSTVAYVGLWSVIVFGEIAINVWRQNFDRSIGDAYLQLDQLRARKRGSVPAIQ